MPPGSDLNISADAVRTVRLGLIALGLMGALGRAALAAPVVPVTPTSDADAFPPPLPVASPITDHFALRADYYWGRVSTDARFDSAAGVPGTPFSAENDLGLSHQAHQVRMELIFRMRARNRLRVDFMDLQRQAYRPIDRTLQYGDVTFQIDSPVQSALNWRQMDLTYTYSFLLGERYELGAGVGVHLVEAEASANVPGTAQSADFSGSGPFATLALDGTWRFTRRWSLNARGQYLHLALSSDSGMLGIYHADLQFRAQRNLALGVGYERQQLELDVRHHDPSGYLRMSISGPEAFLRFSF